MTIQQAIASAAQQDIQNVLVLSATQPDAFERAIAATKKSLADLRAAIAGKKYDDRTSEGKFIACMFDALGDQLLTYDHFRAVANGTLIVH